MNLRYGCAKLRAIEEYDAELLQQLINSEDVEKMTAGWNMAVSSSKQLEWIKNYKNTSDNMRWMIDLDNDVTLGMVMLTKIDWKDRSAEISYKINPYERNRQTGDTKDAVYAVIKYAFEDLGLHRLEASIIDYNIFSQKMIKSMGFQLEGTCRSKIFKNGKWNDEYIYGLLCDEYIAYKDGEASWQVEKPKGRKR